MSDNRGYQMRAPTWVFLGLIMSAPGFLEKLENFSGFSIKMKKIIIFYEFSKIYGRASLRTLELNDIMIEIRKYERFNNQLRDLLELPEREKPEQLIVL
jgi:hypothetical protein